MDMIREQNTDSDNSDVRIDVSIVMYTKQHCITLEDLLMIYLMK